MQEYHQMHQVFVKPKNLKKFLKIQEKIHTKSAHAIKSSCWNTIVCGSCGSELSKITRAISAGVNGASTVTSWLFFPPIIT